MLPCHFANTATVPPQMGLLKLKEKRPLMCRLLKLLLPRLRKAKAEAAGVMDEPRHWALGCGCRSIVSAIQQHQENDDALVKVTCVCIPRVRGWGKMHIYSTCCYRVYSGVVRCLVTPSSTIFISLFVILCLLCLSLRNKRGSHYALATY